MFWRSTWLKLNNAFSNIFDFIIPFIKPECATVGVDKNIWNKTTNFRILINQISKLTNPVFQRTDIFSLIEDNIEDEHDTDHSVEGGQGSHGREISFVVNNHEGEEDEDSGYKVHQHLQHQDEDVQGSQCSVFVNVAKENQSQIRIISF